MLLEIQPLPQEYNIYVVIIGLWFYCGVLIFPMLLLGIFFKYKNESGSSMIFNKEMSSKEKVKTLLQVLLITFGGLITFGIFFYILFISPFFDKKENQD